MAKKKLKNKKTGRKVVLAKKPTPLRKGRFPRYA